MNSFFNEFYQILIDIDNNYEITIFTKLIQVYKNLKKSSKKINSAAKFIDFFVHDILDYTILNKD